MSSPKVYLFIDNSNIFISAKDIAVSREGSDARYKIRIQFDNLVKLAIANREIGKIAVVGSIPPEERAVWDRLEEATGVKPELFEHGQESGGEQGLDQCLQVHMLRAISDNEEPQITVLMTGDGAGYIDGVGFHADLERMHAAGWGIEVLSWERNCKRTLKEWAQKVGVFIPLDNYYDAITYTQGVRNCSSLDTSKRPKSSTHLSPVQLAVEEAKKEYQSKIEELEIKIKAEKVKREKKEIGKEKYLNRMKKKIDK